MLKPGLAQAAAQALVVALGQFAVDQQAEAFLEAQAVDVGGFQLLSLASELTDAQAQQRLQRALPRWKFIYPRLLDYSEDLVPLIVERHAAELAGQLLRLQGQ